MAEFPTPMTLSLHKRKLAIAALVLLAVLVSGAAALRHWAQGLVADKLEARLAGTDFAVSWSALDVGLTGHLHVADLHLADTSTGAVLLDVADVDADVALAALLAGARNLEGLTLHGLVVHVDVDDGHAESWERLAQALKKKRDPTDDGPKTPLLARLGRVTLTEAQIRLTVARGGQALVKTSVSLAGDADFGAVSSQFHATLDQTFGQAKATIALEHPDAQLAAARVAFAPGVAVALQLAWPKAPPDWRVTLGSAALEKQTGGWQLAVGQLALATGDGPLLTVGSASVDAHKNIGLRDVGLRVSPAVQARWLPESAQKQVAALGLSGEWTATLADVRVTRDAGDGATVVARGLHAHVAALDGQVSQVTATLADVHGPTHLENWRTLAVDAPALTLPLDAPVLQANAALMADIAQLVALRKPAEEPEDEDDATDEPLDPDAVPETPPEDDPTKPPPKGTKSKEKPATRWTRTLNNLHRQLFTTHPKLEALWPEEGGLAKKLDGLQMDVTHASAQLLDAHGKPVVGVRDGHVSVHPPVQGVRSVTLGAEPFDAAGSWGHLGVTWRREGHGHRLDVKLSGAGVAQLLAMKAKGLAVEEAADIELQATVRVPDAETIDVDGRLSVDHMGIHWWRLADRPIADLHLHMPFQLHARKHPGHLTFLTPDMEAGGAGDSAVAHLVVVLDVAALDQKPRVRVDVDAPMQDSTEMLHAIPPSLLPTIGRIDAHGPLSWHVGVIVPLASPGASFVDLALGDTLCVMDKFGTIDLEELNGDFDRPVNENGTILDDVHIGPMSEYWTPFAQIPRHVIFAMWASEDSFYRHRGISESLTSKALSIDLSYGRFIYGGSTITQQLVKNIYLTRTKALSRKFEELLIAWQMEKVLGKDRILEIYLNGVEFGPKIYGITRAAWAFYGKTPAELSPKEGVFLAIIKPSPKNGYWTAKSGGWGDWYDMKVTKYMDRLLDEDFITPDEYEAERPFKPKFDIQKDDPP